MKNIILLLSCVVISSLLTHNVFANSGRLINPDNGHSYQRFDVGKTWIQAKEACTNQDGYLATITSYTENSWIKRHFLRNHIIWLGASDAQVEGVWKWITDESFSYTDPAWRHNGEPSNGGMGEDYLALMPEGHWNDGGLPANNSKLSYLCEWNSSIRLYSRILSIVDINGNGSQELVILGMLGTDYKLFIYDSQTKSLINESVIQPTSGFTIKSFSVINDTNNNGIPKIVILITKIIDQSSIIQYHDPLTGNIVSSFVLPK